MACNTFICTNLLGLESLKITLFKDLVRKIIEAEVAENCFFWAFPRLNYLQNKIFK